MVNRASFSYLMSKGRKIAKLTYFYETPDTINANHTFVDDSLRGQGVADKLYQALINFILAKSSLCTQLVAILQENGNEPNLLNPKLKPVNKRFIFKDIFPASCYS